MNNEQEKKARKAGKRSPGYPMCSLEEAVQKAKILWDKDQNNPIPIEAAYEHLGYKPSGGGYAARILAALKKYGLIYEKQNDIYLTDEAVDLALHEPSDEKYIETIKILASKPTIYAKLINDYNGNLPSNATLKIKLIKDYEFNPSSVDDFLLNFRNTIEFANLQRHNTADKEKTSSGGQEVETVSCLPIKPTIKPSMAVNDPGEREIANYPIGRNLNARIIISGASPVTTDSIIKLMALLDLNKEDLHEIVPDEKAKPTEEN
ncbi:MAG: hypothetical protein ACYC7J_16655 [Syntrophales bacterium]